MNKEDIIEELDKLKLKIMVDCSIRFNLDDYKDWVDEKLLLRGKKWDYYNCPVSNKKYALYDTMYSFVSDLFYKKYSDRKEYHKYQPKIQEIIREVIAMMMFIQNTTDLE